AGIRLVHHDLVWLRDLVQRAALPARLPVGPVRRTPPLSRPAVHFDAAWGSEIGRVEGYRLAAEVLARHMMQHRGDRDILIYAFANNCRHHFELRLQLLLDVLQRYKAEAATPLRTHNLGKLWEETRRRLETVDGIETGAALQDTDRVISQLYSVDPDGQNFRYFRPTNGSPALDGEGPIDLLGFHEGLSAAATFLSAALEVVYINDERKRELEAESGR
ncbi:hypothetical protein SAMN05660657_05711, partial [Geodermatophilus amargosae]